MYIIGFRGYGGSYKYASSPQVFVLDGSAASNLNFIMSSLTSTILLALLASYTFAASTFSPARPPAIPLAVKSPYVSAWQQAGSDTESGGPGNGGYLAGHWPTFWQ